MKVIKQEEVDKVADENVKHLSGDCSKFDARDSFKHGVEFAEYKFEELVVRFADWIKLNIYLTESIGSEWQENEDKNDTLTSTEIFQKFLKQRNEKN